MRLSATEACKLSRKLVIEVGENSRAVDVLLETVNMIVRAYFMRLHFPTKGRVVQVLGNSKYRVKIRGKLSDVSCCTGQTFVVNDAVIVIYVQNNQNLKYIIGKA